VFENSVVNGEVLSLVDELISADLVQTFEFPLLFITDDRKGTWSINTLLKVLCRKKWRKNLSQFISTTVVETKELR